MSERHTTSFENGTTAKMVKMSKALGITKLTGNANINEFVRVAVNEKLKRGDK